MLPLSRGDTKAEAALLHAPHAPEYGAKAAYFIEEMTGDRPWWNVLLFEWFSSVMALGNARHLQATDLFPLSGAHSATAIAPRLASAWSHECRRNTRGASLVRALLRAFGKQFVLLLVVTVAYDTLAIVLPVLLVQAIIKYVQDPSALAIRGLLLALLVAVSGVILALVHRQLEYFAAETAVFVHSSVSSVVFQHTLVVSPSTLQRTPTDDVIGYVTSDTARLQHGFLALLSVVGALAQMLVGGFILHSLVGNAIWIGLGTAIVGMSVSVCVKKRVRKYDVPVMEARDDRLVLSEQVLTGIKSFKLLTWETSFADRILELRDHELRHVKTLLFARGLLATVATIAPVLVTTATLLACAYLVGGAMEISTVLPALLLLLLLLREPLALLPKRVGLLRQAYDNQLKINAFLIEPVRVMATAPHATNGVSVVVKNADFKWDTIAAPKTELDELLEAQGIAENLATGPVLHHLSFYASPGELHAVVGAPGSGKSSFLAGIVGLVRCTAGEVVVQGSVAYVNREPFLLNASIRENICFGQPFHAERYVQAVKAACLKYDWSILPQADRTIVNNERGVGLTATQRLRIAIARSVYQNADVYVFDDVLSIMDAGIAKKIFKNCMQTVLKSKVVIIATQSLKVVKRATNIVVLARGTIVEAGDFKTLMANKKWGLLSELVHAKSTKAGDDQDPGADSSDEADNDSDGDDASVPLNLATFAPIVSENEVEQNTSAEDEAGEDNVRTAVALWLVRAFGERGYVIFGMVVVLYVTTALAELASISALSLGGLPLALLERYVAFSVLVVVSTMAATVASSLGSLHASQYVHQALVERLTRAPMAFFDATPINHVVARVSKDLGTVDAGLVSTGPRLLTASAQLLVTVGLFIALSPWLMLVLAPLMLGLYRIEEYVGTPMRDLERLQLATVTPLQTSMTEVLRGMVAIRLYNADHLFVHAFHSRLETLQQAFLFQRCAQSWLGIRVDALYVVLVTCVSLGAIQVHTSSADAALHQAGRVGVALVFAFSLSPVFFALIKACNETVYMLLAGGRIKAFSKMPIEAALESVPQLRPSSDWPSRGTIAFENVSLRYRQGLPRILRGVTFDVSGGSTMAIVGSPGSGKKSVFAALTRLVESATGTIAIDGVDISKIGLHDLRSKIAVLSPDASFIAGSIRSNLDATHRFTDDEIWTAIRKVQLQSAVLSLDEVVNERATNYSDSERQLLSLVHALLRRPKIFLIDEAENTTSNPETDIIDQCLQNEFPDATKLVITQRTAVVTAATTVLVLVNGQIAEFGTPKELQKNARSMLRTILDHWKRGSPQLRR